MNIKSSTKVLSVFLIIILLGSSVQTSFLSIPQQTLGKTSIIQKAFATSSNDISLIGNYVIFGFNGVTIEKEATINSGNIGIQNATAEVDLQKSSTIKPGPISAVVGDVVTIEKSTTVNDVYFNHLNNKGTITGNQNTPLILPVVKSLPSFPTITAGTNTIDVPKSSSLVLQAGNFGDVTVEDYATLELAGGIYNFKSLTMDKNSNLVFDQSSQVRISTDISGNKNLVIGPSSSTTNLNATGIVFFVGGDVNMGDSTVIKANIYAPNGEILMAKNTIATGSFIANTVDIQKDSVFTLSSAFISLDLVNQFIGINSELGKISDISNEAVVSDYLNQNITALQTSTNNLVTNLSAKTSLLSILSSALQSTSDAGNAVLALNKPVADLKINATRSFITSYINQVNSLSGTSIPTATANILVSNAQQILTSSFKNGLDIVSLVKNNPLTVTGSIIDKAKTDGTSLRQITNSLILSGFKVTLNAVHHSPTITDILFSNVAALQSFDIIVSNNTLSLDVALGFFQDASSKGQVINTSEFAYLMNITPLIVNGLTNSTSVSDARLLLVVSCQSIFTYQECNSGFTTSTNPQALFTIDPKFVSSQFLGPLVECIESGVCENILHAIVDEFIGAGINSIFPTVTVVKVVNGGTLNASAFMIYAHTNLLSANPSNFTAKSAPGSLVFIPFLTYPGTNYNLTEGPVSGYTQNFNGTCAGTITHLGQHQTCLITNTFTNSSSPAPAIITDNAFKSVFSVYLNNGTGGFSNPVDYLKNSAGQGNAFVAVGDLNNDGNLDIVTGGNSTNPGLYVFLNNGTNGFNQPIITTGTNSLAIQNVITIADLNGDGKQDVVELSNQNSNLAVYFGNGTGKFGTPNVYGLPQGSSAMSITAADLNGDGKPDVAVGSIGSDIVFLNNGTGGFGTPRVYSVSQDNPIRIISADFNGTGKSDLITANNYGTSGISILYNNGTGGFGNSKFIALGTSACNANAYSVTVGDFNGDGKVDFATGNQVYNLSNPYATVAVFLNNGHGFGPPICSGMTTFSNGLNLFDIASADFNRDGKLDVVTVASNYGPSSTDKITVFFGNGTGGFNSQKVISETGYTPLGVATTVPNSGH